MSYLPSSQLPIRRQNYNFGNSQRQNYSQKSKLLRLQEDQQFCNKSRLDARQRAIHRLTSENYPSIQLSRNRYGEEAADGLSNVPLAGEADYEDHEQHQDRYYRKKVEINRPRNGAPSVERNQHQNMSSDERVGNQLSRLEELRRNRNNNSRLENFQGDWRRRVDNSHEQLPRSNYPRNYDPRDTNSAASHIPVMTPPVYPTRTAKSDTSLSPAVRLGGLQGLRYPSIEQMRRREEELLALIKEKQLELNRLRKSHDRQFKNNLLNGSGHAGDVETDVFDNSPRNSLSRVSSRLKPLPKSQRMEPQFDNHEASEANESSEEMVVQIPKNRTKPKTRLKQTSGFSEKSTYDEEESDERGLFSTASHEDTRDLNPSYHNAHEYEAPDRSQPLVKCQQCERQFASDRIEKHRKICRKISTKQRKVFEPSKMRLQGTEMAKYYRPDNHEAGIDGSTTSNLNHKNKRVKKSSSSWRQEHSEFMATIKYAKAVSAAEAAGVDRRNLPPPPRSMRSDDYVQCPHCSRKFAPAVADRHVPKCQNIKSKPTVLLRRH